VNTGFCTDWKITKRDLLQAPGIGLRRLAGYLKLNVNDEMSDRQVAKLIYWRITRVDYGRLYF
jgi:hypothetical protein